MSGSFAQQLLVAARPHDLATNPFLKAVINGTANRDAVREWACIMAVNAESFPATLCEVIAICDDIDVRKALIANMLEEEGITAFVPGHGVTRDPARAHGAMARRMVYALGGMDAEVDAQKRSHPRWYRERLAAGDWIAAMAFFAIGYEANVPDSFRMIHRALVDHYGIADEDLIFLTEHMEADERHGVESATLIERAATTENARASAIEGARRGGVAWWMLHRAFATRIAAIAQ